MDLKALRSFVAVAELQNFSAAARELNTVQPAISRQIADLEDKLGVSLFWRNTREVKITAAGQSLLRDARLILTRAQEAKKEAQRAARGETGSLNIGYLGPACLSFIPQLVKAYVTHYPEVQVSMQEMTVRQQADQFREGRLDVGFSRPLEKATRKGVSTEDLYVDTLMALVPDTHPLATAKRLRLRDLAPSSFILFKREEAVELFDQIIGACQQDGFSPHLRSQPQNMQTVVTEVASGLGVAVVPGCVRKLYTQGCTFLQIETQKPSIPTQVHYRSAPLKPTVEAFVQLTLQARPNIRKQMQ